jgi:hypothetical protein
MVHTAGNAPATGQWLFHDDTCEWQDDNIFVPFARPDHLPTKLTKPNTVDATRAPNVEKLASAKMVEE